MNKKELRSQIEQKIETALAEFAKGISEKKFKKHIKKAAKIVSDGLAMPAASKKAVKPATQNKVKSSAKKGAVKSPATGKPKK